MSERLCYTLQGIQPFNDILPSKHMQQPNMELLAKLVVLVSVATLSSSVGEQLYIMGY